MKAGNLVVIKEIDHDNIEWMRNQRNDPELRQYFREWKDITKDQQEEWYRTRGNNSNPNHIYFEILKKENMEIIGCCGLHYINWQNRCAEFGVFLSKESRGRGYGKEALSLMFDCGFKEVNLHKIWAEVYDFNDAIKLYKKLGFKEDGILRDSCFKGGKYHNSIMISLLENEWKN